MLQVLKQCGDDFSRENIMKQATSLQDLEVPVLLPGIKVNTSPTNYHPIRQLQLSAGTARPGSCSATSSRAPSASSCPPAKPPGSGAAGGVGVFIRAHRGGPTAVLLSPP